MTSIALILTYLGCFSSGAMLSMLLLLVGAYISASLWLINQKVIYTGLLYILVYVGAIVVLIMFVVQLTNTSLTNDTNTTHFELLILQNVVLLVSLVILLTSAYSILNNEFWLNISYFNLTENLTYNNSLLISNLLGYLDHSLTNLPLLAFSIFNEYGYILVISVHAILLAIIGPIKLAISDMSNH